MGGLFGLGDLATGGLISGASNLIGGIIGGIGAGAAEKKNREFQKQMMELQRNWRVGDRNAFIQNNKPQTPYYQSQNMPGVDKVLATAVMSNLFNRMGGNVGGGLDLASILNGMNFNSQPAQASITPAPNNPGGGPNGPVEAIARRMLQQKYSV